MSRLSEEARLEFAKLRENLREQNNYIARLERKIEEQDELIKTLEDFIKELRQ